MSSKLILTAAAAMCIAGTAEAKSAPAAQGPQGVALAPTGPGIGPDATQGAPSDMAEPRDEDGAVAPPMPGAPAALRDITELAGANPQLSTLTAALKAAGLQDTLRGPGPFTLFAPSNAAFAKLAPGVLDDLLKPENKGRLVRLLTYHVVPAAMLTADITGATAAPASVAGPTLAVDGRNSVSVNGAQVVGSQAVASNGVVHVIDTVLEPR
jgi:uncharacterized surface protein with fasciclin (FAS1) repeats